jgi:hypothetical protein
LEHFISKDQSYETGTLIGFVNEINASNYQDDVSWVADEED